MGQSQLWLIMASFYEIKIPATFGDCLRLRQAVPERRLPDNHKTTLDALETEYVLRIQTRNKREFQSLTAYYFHTDESSVTMLLEDLLQGNLEKFALRYQAILEDTASYYDLVNKNSYQAHWPAVRTLLLGMLMPLENSYKIISNREKGQGRFDICLESRKQDKPSFLFELEYTKDDSQILRNWPCRDMNRSLLSNMIMACIM